MLAVVYRMMDHGQRLERAAAQARSPARGELLLRARLTNRGPGWDVFLATLLRPDYGYVLPPLDQAKITAIRGRWMLIAGTEVHPHSRNPKRLGASSFEQEWWCRIEGAATQAMVLPAPSKGLKKMTPSF